MRTVTHNFNVCSYDELCDEAREVARNWWREQATHDTYWHEGRIEWIKEILEPCGLKITHIRFSGFWSDGDGASFIGTFTKPADCYSQEEIVAKINKISDELSLLVNDLLNWAPQYGVEINEAADKESEVDECSVDIYNQDTYASCSDEFIRCVRALMRWAYRELEEAHGEYYSEERVSMTIRRNEYEFTENGKIYK